MASKEVGVMMCKKKGERNARVHTCFRELDEVRERATHLNEHACAEFSCRRASEGTEEDLKIKVAPV